MKSQEEIEEQIAKIKKHLEEAEEAAPEEIFCRIRIQALKLVLK